MIGRTKNGHRWTGNLNVQSGRYELADEGNIIYSGPVNMVRWIGQHRHGVQWRK